jgi:hypothetical protein
MEKENSTHVLLVSIVNHTSQRPLTIVFPDRAALNAYLDKNEVTQFTVMSVPFLLNTVDLEDFPGDSDLSSD